MEARKTLDFLPYDSVMEKTDAFLTLKIDTSQPVEMDAFIGAFSSLAQEFQREVRAKQPRSEAEARIFIKEVRQGSTIIEMIPEIGAAAYSAAAFIDQVTVVENFVKTWGERIQALASGQLGRWQPSKSELNNWTNAVAAIARDPDANSTLEAATFEDGRRQVRAAFQFSTPEAVRAQKTIDATYRELEAPDHADHERVLMVFTRSDIGNVSVGKRSGERVKIEEISSRPLALIYASDLAEERIKHEIRESEDNVFKKGFVVDVNIRMNNGKPAVYAVTHVHEIIELPDDFE